MGVLTNDMTRLCTEIRGLRGARKAIINDLMRVTKDRRSAVAAMQAGFRKSHAEMARRTKANRGAFISSLKLIVIAIRQRAADLRREFAKDIAGAHQAWFGPTPAERLQIELGGRRRAEAEERARREQEELRRAEAEVGAEEAQEEEEEGEEGEPTPAGPRRRRRRR